MNKYLILNFKDAKLFRKDRVSDNKRCKDISFTSYNSKIQKRKDIEPFVEPITVHQISNMLHVLFNERPVPSHRKVLYERNDVYFNAALNSYIKIDTPKFYNKSIDKDVYHFEFIQTNKALHNAWSMMVTLNWKMVEEYMDSSDKFNTFVSELNKQLGFDSKSKPFNNIIKDVQNLSDHNRLELYEVISNLGGCGALIYVFGQYKNGKFEDSKPSTLSSTPNRMARTTVNGVDEYASLWGKIIVPVTDEMIRTLENNSKGNATLLDGGFVWIDSIKNGATVSIDEFTKVSDISDERMKF
ncbi:MAG: hypothetical protein ACOC2U_00465 [bacterium]